MTRIGTRAEVWFSNVVAAFVRYVAERTLPKSVPMLMRRVAGERIYDIWQVNEDAEYHEAGVSSAQAALASERLVPRKAKPRAA